MRSQDQVRHPVKQGARDPAHGLRLKHIQRRTPESAAATGTLEAADLGTLTGLLERGRLREAEERVSALLRAQPQLANTRLHRERSESLRGWC